ncbi:MAG: O-antigen ligase family protein [Candidatus Hinthialibacter antarcticus]|nr:O-antigen ligase family protein [Candidatus Hinthialibacter antarcticus]
MIEWMIVVLTVVSAGCLLGSPVMAAALLLVASTLDGTLLPVPGGDISAAHLGALIAFPSLLIGAISNRKRFDGAIQSAMVFLGIGVMVSSFFVVLTPGVLNVLVKFVIYIATFFCIAHGLDLKSNKLWILAATTSILLSAGLSMLRVLYQESPTGIHLTGGFLDWNYYAVFLCVWLPIIWQMARVEGDPKRQQWFYVLAVVLCVLIIGTRSKPGVSIFILTVVSMFMTGLVPRRYLLWLVPAALFGGIIAFRGGDGALFERFTAILEQPRMQERISNWRLALELFFQHPIVGVGVNQYEAYSNQWAGNLPFTVSRMHSGILVLLAECGIFAGLGYCIIFVHLIFGAYNQFSQPTRNSNQAIFCSVIALGASSLLTNTHDHLFTWCFLGWMAALLQSNHSIQATGASDAPCQNDDSPEMESPSV